MKDFLLEILKKAWLKPKSIAPSFLLLLALYVSMMTTLEALDGIVLDATSHWIVAAIFVVIWFIYIIFCIRNYLLPRAPKGYISVLFCIDAENEKLFDCARYKLVNNFTDSLAQNSRIPFKAFYIAKDRVAKFDLKQNEDCHRLLQITHCNMLVLVRYSADYIDAPEQFELKIKYGVRHPKFDNTGEEILAHDMDQVAALLVERRFEKAETFDVFACSTQTLVFACQYIIGLVLLLEDKCVDALELLQQARSTAECNSDKKFDTKKFVDMVDNRRFVAYQRSAQQCIAKFQNTHNMDFLIDAERLLEQSNKICSGSYSYYLVKAYILVMLHKDRIEARKCIDRCKQINLREDWMYSDAFLCAYASNTAGHIIAKYNKAFKVETENIVQLADYIEVIRYREPEKISLSLALGILYSKMGNNKLARKNLSVYLEQADITNSKDRSKIEKILCTISCDDTCTSSCSCCPSVK